MPFQNWNFRQRPSGSFKWLLRQPVHLFHLRLGFLFGNRLILLTHRGRRSGELHETPLEVVAHADGEYFVCSGTGPQAQWYLNLKATPPIEVQVKNRRWRPTMRFVDAGEAAKRFGKYEAKHKATAEKLLASMGNSYDGTDAGRIEMMAKMPMVAFSDSPAA